MRKFTLLLGGLFALATASASAQEVKAEQQPLRSFARLLAQPKAAPVATPQKASPLRALNTEKAKGTLMYASTQTDWENDPGLISFRSQAVYDYTKLCILSDRDADPFRMQTMWGGVLYTDPQTQETSYLATIANNYSFVVYPNSFVKVDVNTGKITHLNTDIAELKGTWYPTEAVCQHPVTKELWAMCRDTEEMISHLGVLDPATGLFTEKKRMSEWYSAMAIDAKGNIWAVRIVWDEQGTPEDYSDDTIAKTILCQLDAKNDFAEVNTVDLKYSEDGTTATNFHMYWTNCMAFDYSTGQLYGLLMAEDSYNQYLYKIDTATGALTDRQYNYSTCLGLAVPSYFADAPEAPARVENLKGEVIENGGKVTLSWNLPTKTWDGQELASISAVNIYRNSLDADPVAVLTEGLNPGEEVSWTDETPDNGLQTYYVKALVDNKGGIPDSWQAWGGKDIPSAVENVNLYAEGNRIAITWTAPVTGEHDGYLDASELTYKVTRFPDNVVIADGITKTACADEVSGSMKAYHYTVVPSSSVGEGPSVQTETVMAGSSYPVPYATEFANAEEAALWTAVDGNGDGKYFNYRDFDISCRGLGLECTNYGASNDYALSPKIALEAGKTYRVKMDIYFSYITTQYETTIHDFEFTVGQGTTAEAQSTVFHEERGFANDVYNSRHQFEDLYTATESGDYNFGLHWTSTTNDNIALCGFSVVEVYDNDLTVTGFAGSSLPAAESAESYKVTVSNVGKLPASNFTVKVARKDGENLVELGSTQVTETLEPETSTVVTVVATPDVAGEATFVAVVNLEGDQNADNNTAEMSVTVADAGTVPFNAVADTKKNNAEVTEMPLYFYYKYSTVQSLYYPSDFTPVLDEEENGVCITRLAYEYSDNDGGTFSDVPVKLYVGATDKASYTATQWGSSVESTEWVPLEAQTLVFDGTVSSELGKGNLVAFDFTTPVTLPQYKNLVVTVQREGSELNAYPVVFNVYNNDGYSEVYRTLRYGSKHAQFGFNDKSGVFARPALPVLHLAISTNTGIKNVTIGSKDISYDSTTGSVQFNGHAAAVSIYNLNGQVVATGKQTRLATGAYVVKVVDENGNIHTTKISVR